MSDIFTLKRIVLVGLVGIIASISAFASEYKSMIRYDRVWEHVSVNWNDKKVYYVKFDGQEEINGNAYHRLISFRKAGFDYDKDGQPYLFDVDENYYQHEGYMREEDGKVYTLVATGTDNWGYPVMALYIPDAPNIPDNYTLEEKILYDFTCKEGESYRGLQVNDYYAEEMAYKVESISSVEIDGEEHRVMWIYPDFEWDYMGREPIIEGVGIGSYGCLTTINFLWLPSCPCMDHIFNRVLSTDGSVLYKTGEDVADVPVKDFLGIEEISDQINVADNNKYDIFGRCISSPAPGQLYIQGGKKLIGR